MKPVSPEVARLTNEGLALVIGGRTYGADVNRDLSIVQSMAVPKELKALTDALVAKSKLLKIEKPTYGDIYECYGHDLALMERHRAAFKFTIENAIRARAAIEHSDAGQFLERLIAEVEPIAHKPTMRLSESELRLEPEVLLRNLQAQYRKDVESLAQNIALWFHVLAEREFVCVIDRFNPTALRYHFFRMDSERSVADRKETVEGDFLKGRTYTTTTKTDVKVFNERRVHTLVDAKSYPLGAYKQKVPERIARFIDTMPEEVRPFVTIVDGKLTTEEVHRKMAESRVETDVKSVFIPDPAVVLFDNWGLAGWGGSSPESQAEMYRGHSLARANAYLVGSIGATALAGFGAMTMGGTRAAALVAICGAILTFLHQLGLRLDSKR